MTHTRKRTRSNSNLRSPRGSPKNSEEPRKRKKTGGPGERRSKKHKEPLTPMLKEYIKSKEFTSLKGLRFPRRANHKETIEIEWSSPLTERQPYKNCKQQKSSYNVPRRYCPLTSSRRPQVPPPLGTVVHRNCPSPAHPGPGRFEGSGPPHHNMVERTDSPRHMAHGPVTGREHMGRSDGPPQGPGRFRGPIGQQPPVRHEGQGPGPRHSEDSMQCFEAPCHFNNMGPAPDLGPPSASMGFQQQPSRFDGPLRFDGPRHFDGPGQPGPRYDVPHQGEPQHFKNFQGQQSYLRFNPQHNLQPSMKLMGPPIYKKPMAPQRFMESMNSQFPTLSVAFPGQQNIQQGGNFNVQPQFSQPGPAAFYNPAAPAVDLQQPVMGNMKQPFLPQNPLPFPQQNPQVSPPKNLSYQVCIDNLLDKLISVGVIKPSQPEATPTSSSVSLVVEEEEKEQEVDKEGTPDLTSFSTDNLKQHNESVVTKQCRQCSMHFTADQTKMYADHLDWHFEQNRARKKRCRWYYNETDWIELEDIDLGEHANSQIFDTEKAEKVEKKQAATKAKQFQRTRATKGKVGECCETCQETFETYWVSEEEDWFLKNAIKVDDKNFHPLCFEDYKKKKVTVA